MRTKLERFRKGISSAGHTYKAQSGTSISPALGKKRQEARVGGQPGCSETLWKEGRKRERKGGREGGRDRTRERGRGRKEERRKEQREERKVSEDSKGRRNERPNRILCRAQLFILKYEAGGGWRDGSAV